MNSMQIHCLLTLGKTKSITKTAQKLFVSQPTISKNLQKLESEVGFNLIQVKGHQTHFTKQGKAFYNLMNRLNQQFKIGIDQIYDMEKMRPIIICLTMVPFEKAFLPIFVDLYEKTFKDQILLSAFHPAFSYKKNINLFFEQKADFILMQKDFFNNDPRIGFKALINGTYSVIIAKNHKLANKHHLNIADICNERIWIWNSKISVKTVREIENKLRESNPRVEIYEISSVVSCEMYAATGNGISIVPSFAYDKTNPNVVYNFLDCNIPIIYGASFLKSTAKKPYFSSVIKYLKIAISAEKSKW